MTKGNNMKNYIFGLILSIFILFSVSCSDKTDSITLARVDTLPNGIRAAEYKFDIGKTVGSANIIAEMWENGECTKSAPLTINDSTKTLSCILRIDDSSSEDGGKGINVQIDTEGAAVALAAYFEADKDVLGYSFTAHREDEIIEVSPETEVILCSMAFDTGSGVRAVDCKTLAEEPERLEEYSCILIVRAELSAELIDAASELISTDLEK